jgi:hypothetical protein
MILCMADHREPLSFLQASSLDEVLRLPAPLEVGYERLDELQVASGLETLMATWTHVLERDTSFTQEASAGSEATRWRQASLLLAQHFAQALPTAEAVFTRGGKRSWSPFLFDFQHKLLTAEYGFDAAVERRLLSEFCSGYWSAFFTEVVGSVAVGLTPVGYDQFIYWPIEHISHVALHSPHEEHLKIGHVLVEALAQRARDTVDRRDKNDLERRDKLWGPLIGARELGALASRSEGVINRYGEKLVEEQFEQNLSILFQSFGFIVVPTTRGERRVDLVCIAAQAAGGSSYAFMVEAKSTSKPYSLPTKDSRAILEYVDNVKHKLSTLPPLKFVLIVGPEPANTLLKKLNTLEREVSTPVRYCMADTLASLRSSFPGAMPQAIFLDTILSAPGIVNRDHLGRIVRHIRDQDDAHSDFVRRMLGSV